MRFLPVFFTLLISISIIAVGQEKNDYVHFDKLTEVEGTEYVIASIEQRGKLNTKSKHLLFINTINGETKQIDFPKDAFIKTFEQIRIEEHGINLILLVAKTINLNGNKEIDWNDPQQVFILSSDGKSKTQLTEDGLFVSTWAVNQKTGTITVTGHYDSNSNGKHDKTDENKILIYSLKTLKLIWEK